MIILGVDFGLRKIGRSLAEKGVAFPLRVVRYGNEKEAIKMLTDVIEKENVGKVVVGISEGEMADKTKEFVNNLKVQVNTPVELWNETLSTRISQNLAIEAGLARHKRKSKEDAYAAAVILQDYLDSGN